MTCICPICYRLNHLGFQPEQPLLLMTAHQSGRPPVNNPLNYSLRNNLGDGRVTG